MKIKNFIYILCSVVLFSCEPEIDKFEPSAGDADFSKMVAIGNSLTAGFADGELYRSAQLNSFPNIVAQQLKHVGGGEFVQPLMVDDIGFGNRMVLDITTDCLGEAGLAPVPLGEEVNPDNFARIYDEKGPFNNFGVPGAKADHLLAPGYSLLNPYFNRFSKDVNNSSVLGDAMESNPTFFTLWIGNNDILSYAINGGEGEQITDVDYYNNIMNAIIDQLTSNNAKGAIANIPDVIATPFFTTIPSMGLVLDADMASALNSAYSALPHIEFQPGPNGFVVVDLEEPGSMRQLKPDELLLLSTPQDSIKCAGWGSQKPIPLEFYLSSEQIQDINIAVDEYNEFIKKIAEENNLAHVDINSLLKEAESGISFDGISFNTQFVTGGVFSLDGIHLSARGNALVANYFIDAINETYNSSVPKVSVTEYKGIIFP